MARSVQYDDQHPGTPIPQARIADLMDDGYTNAHEFVRVADDFWNCLPCSVLGGVTIPGARTMGAVAATEPTAVLILNLLDPLPEVGGISRVGD